MSQPGALVIIGGKEDKVDGKKILKEFVNRAGDGDTVVITSASQRATASFDEYDRVFRSLGIKHIRHLDVEKREEAHRDEKVGIFKNATSVFFTGGDQLKITSKLGGTQIAEKIREIHRKGGTIAGTSAGASVMSETMLVSGGGGESHKVGGALFMAPGLGFAKNMIIDQHFAQRGRMGRLLGAIAQNPGVLGIGIDEDTAIVVERNHLKVLGSGAVYVADGQQVTYTNVSEIQLAQTMCMFNVRLHVLADGCCYDLAAHRPLPPPDKRKNGAHPVPELQIQI